MKPSSVSIALCIASISLPVKAMTSAEIEAHCRELEANRRAWTGVDKAAVRALDANIRDCHERATRARANESAAKQRKAASGGRPKAATSAAPDLGTSLAEMHRRLQEPARAERRERLRRQVEEAEEDARKGDEQRAARAAASSAAEAALRRRFAAVAAGGPHELSAAERCDERRRRLFEIMDPDGYARDCAPVIAAEACRDRIGKGLPVGDSCLPACRVATVAGHAVPPSCSSTSLGEKWRDATRLLGWADETWSETSPSRDFRYRVRFGRIEALSDGDPGVVPTEADLTYCPKRAAPGRVDFGGYRGRTNLEFNPSLTGCDISVSSVRCFVSPSGRLRIEDVEPATCKSIRVSVVAGPMSFVVALPQLGVEFRDARIEEPKKGKKP